MTLTEFLLARIAEDEAAAHEGAALLSEDGRWHEATQHSATVTVRRLGALSPARVIAECDAKRNIVNLADYWRHDHDQFDQALKLMAVVYRDHPDYSEDWRP